jgi:zinc/manganese transport system permease protein
MTNPYFSFNIIADLQAIFAYDFMRNAFLAGTIVAIIAGVVGYFVVLRRSSFAAHGLSHAGFTGAAGAVLFGINPIIGLLVFTVGGALLMGSLGERTTNRDVEIGTVLAFMLGLGILFISLYSGYATEAYSLLFGEILGISGSSVIITLVAGFFILAMLAILYRPLVFTSLDEDVAEAKGVPLSLISIGFMVLVGVATSISVQVVGVLLIFALMVTPAAIAVRFTKKPSSGMMFSVIIALLVTWISLFVSFYLSYPVSFFITSIVFMLYLLARFIKIN